MPFPDASVFAGGKWPQFAAAQAGTDRAFFVTAVCQNDEVKEDLKRLPPLRSREEFVDYLDGYAVRASEEDDYHQKGRQGLLKSYILETVGGSSVPPIEMIAEDAGLSLQAIGEDGLFSVADHRLGEQVGLLEVFEGRHPVIYTLLDSQHSDPWITRSVSATPWLDRVWISAPLFAQLWRYVQATADPRRYTRMTFEHQAFYEADEPGDSDELVEDESVATDRDTQAPERRASRFAMTDRIETIKAKLPHLQETYRPLHSITQLRLPAQGRGGHDFFYDGKVTNRSDSFVDHRQNVEFVLSTYRHVTESAERVLWLEGSQETDQFALRGAPFLVEFSEELGQETFTRWIDRTFGRRRNRFRLAGSSIELSAGKVQFYGVDRHLWQPVYLEITRQHILGIIPRGTCGNSLHRLLTNVQHLVDPAAEAWVGESRFSTLIQDALPLGRGRDSKLLEGELAKLVGHMSAEELDRALNPPELPPSSSE